MGEYVFGGCTSLKTVTNLSPHLDSIPSGTFARCGGLVNINLPTFVTSVGSSAFLECRSLKVVDIPRAITEIGEKAFCGCESLREVNVPPSSLLEKIGKYTFLECGALKEIAIPASTIVEKETFDPSVTEVVRHLKEDIDLKQIVENRLQALSGAA